MTNEAGKKQLIDRLIESIEEERQRENTTKLKLEAKHRNIVDLEESCAVYAVERNRSGQVELEDCDDHQAFTVILSTRGNNYQYDSKYVRCYLLVITLIFSPLKSTCEW